MWYLLQIGGFSSRPRCGLRAFLIYRRCDARLPVEQAIIEKLRNGPCRFDEVVSELSDFSLAEIAVAVDSHLWEMAEGRKFSNSGSSLWIKSFDLFLLY